MCRTARDAPSCETQSGSHQTRGTSRRRDSCSSPLRSTSTARLPPVVLLREEDRRFSQDLPLHPQLRVLIPQPRKLLALVAAQPARSLPLSGLLLPNPAAQRDIRDPQVLRQSALRLVAKQGEPDRLATELLRIRRSS